MDPHENEAWLAQSLLAQLADLTGDKDAQAQAIFDAVITAGGTYAEPGTDTSWAADINWTISLYGLTAVAESKDKAVYDWIKMAKRAFSRDRLAIKPWPPAGVQTAQEMFPEGKMAGAVHAPG